MRRSDRMPERVLGRRARRIGGLVFLLVCMASIAVFAQDDLAQRITKLIQEGRYDLARDLIDDHERNGQVLDDEVKWLRARLERDPDRFDRRAVEVANQDPSAQRRIEATLARAREQFARGRYRTAAELLAPLAQAPDTASDGRVLLWLGMAEQASGQVGVALNNLRAIGQNDPNYGMAQALLADLALRAGRLEAADEHARKAMAADETMGAIAWSVLGRSGAARGDEEAVENARERLRRDFPGAAETQWVDSGSNDAAAAVDEPAAVAEVIDAERRNFGLQFGAFRDRSLALRMLEDISGTLEELRIEVDRSQESPLYRVVGGSFVTRAQAEAAQTRLAGRGVQTLVLAPTRGGP